MLALRGRESIGYRQQCCPAPMTRAASPLSQHLLQLLPRTGRAHTHPERGTADCTIVKVVIPIVGRMISLSPPYTAATAATYPCTFAGGIMRAWGSCAVSVLASASYTARAFVPTAGFRGVPLLSRSLRRPRHASSSCSGGPTGNNGNIAGERGLWVVHRRGCDPAAGIWQQGGRVRLLTSMSSGSSSVSGGAVQETSVGSDWTATKVCC